MKKLLTAFACLALATSSLFASEVYRVVGEDGQVTFTDSPSANAKAETVDMPKTNIAVAPPIPTKTAGESKAMEGEANYTKARISKPSNNTTIPPGQREVQVKLDLVPPLQTGHLVQLYINGRKQGPPSASSTFTVSNLNRGKHSVHADILGADKKRNTKTQTVTFHIAALL
ncbi:MAG: DUF4124 domain-containing protein [Candidatus Reddybacter sp.]